MRSKILSLISPQTVVVIGASQREGSLGRIIMSNLLSGSIAESDVCVVNPKYTRVLNAVCYAKVADMPHVPDLAILVSPAKTIPKLMVELGQKGVGCAIIISAGFSESGRDDGRLLEERMLEAARRFNIRVVGPNCLGVLSPVNNFNASFSHLMPKKGRIGVISQSGAMLTSIIDWACGRGIGFSHLISLGDMADIGFPEALDFMSSDPGTDAILIYMESVHDARRFISAARAASRTKPVVVLKVGRSDEGCRAAASHTGALAGSDDVYQTVFDRSGLLRVDGMRELFYAAASLTSVAPLEVESLAILTNGGGMGVLATDALIKEGGVLAALSDETIERLNKVLPETWSHANPIDIIGDAGPKRYSDALAVLQKDAGVGAVLVLNCPTAVASSTDAADAIVQTAKNNGKCVLASWVGGATAEASRTIFAQHGVPSYATPEAAVNSFMHLVRYKRNQNILMETPPALAKDLVFDFEAARKVIAAALADGREWLNEWEAKEVLLAYGIPTVETRMARTIEEAVQFAEELGFPVVVKVVSPDIVHKSDVRGVVLNLDNAEAVRQAAQCINCSVKQMMPAAKIEGFSVQHMVDIKGAHELILGVKDDPTFGPVLLFGLGGTAVEIYDDKALALPPLNLKLAKDMVSRTKVYRLLKGYREQEPIDMNALLLTLIKLSQLVVDFDRLAELDINPLLANKHGVIALDARIRISIKKTVKKERLAIHPYPQELEELLHLGSGEKYILRPIKPEDEPELIQNFEQLTKEEIWFRFFHAVKTMEHNMAARFTQIDYDREMALVVTDQHRRVGWRLYAVVRLITDKFEPKAEFSLIVNNAIGGQGVGTLLLARIIAYAKSRGIEEIYGSILTDNRAMIYICKKAGFTVKVNHEEAGTVDVKLALNAKD